MITPPTAWILLGSLLLDYALGDPWHWYHPVQAMGSYIGWGSRFIVQATQKPWIRRMGGGLLTVNLVGLSYGYGWGLIELGSYLHPGLGILIHIILLSSCLGSRSLRRAALEVLDPLEKGDLTQARQMLSRYVGRDTATLDETEICRAVLEMVAENTPDGGTGPLGFALLGGAPVALAYKAVSTLDSMVGYRRDPYTHLGTVPARLEDILTWIPARLTVLTLALMQPQPWAFWQAVRRDAHRDPSPNSGWSEAAFAHALKVQLGGINVYQGIPTEKPLLGDPQRDLSPEVVREALGLMRRVMVVWGSLGVGWVVWVEWVRLG